MRYGRGEDFETSLRSTEDYIEQRKTRSGKVYFFSRSQYFVDNVINVNAILIYVTLQHRGFWCNFRKSDFRNRQKYVAIVGSLPRRYCVRSLESVGSGEDGREGMFGLRKAISALCSKTESIMNGRDVFVEHIVGFAQLNKRRRIHFYRTPVGQFVVWVSTLIGMYLSDPSWASGGTFMGSAALYVAEPL